MKYTKPALSFEQQADQLLNRGFQADRTRLIETLSRVSYYLLSAYCRLTGSDGCAWFRKMALLKSQSHRREN